MTDRKIKSILFFLLGVLSFSILHANQNKIEITNKKKSQAVESKLVIGATEYLIKIEPPGVAFEARIDTGAKFTSIDARDIIPFERDGKKWVKFTMKKGSKEFHVERPIYDTVLVKQHGKDPLRRYMVKVRISAGEVSQLIPVSLTDRSKFEYATLIGRNFLKDYFVVDVSKHNQLMKVVKTKKIAVKKHKSEKKMIQKKKNDI